MRTYLNKHDDGFSVSYHEADTKAFSESGRAWGEGAVQGSGSVFFDADANRVDALPVEYRSRIWLSFYNHCKAHGLTHVAKLRERRARRQRVRNP